jgi:hypothetical protein
LHIHSKYSDGLYSPTVIAKQAKDIGLDGFGITDHNTVKGQGEAKRAAKRFGLRFVPGVEVSSHQGHIIGFGVEEPVGVGSAAEVVDRIHDLGGVAVAPHPYDVLRHGVWRVLGKIDFDMIEIYNSRTFFEPLNRCAMVAAKRLKKPGVVGSDAHALREIGLSRVRVESVGDIYKGKIKIEQMKWAGMHRIALDKFRRILRGKTL